MTTATLPEPPEESMEARIRANLGKAIDKALQAEDVSPSWASLAARWLDGFGKKKDAGDDDPFRAAIMESLRKSREKGGDVPPVDTTNDDAAT